MNIADSIKSASGSTTGTNQASRPKSSHPVAAPGFAFANAAPNDRFKVTFDMGVVTSQAVKDLGLKCLTVKIKDPYEYLTGTFEFLECVDMSTREALEECHGSVGLTIEIFDQMGNKIHSIAQRIHFDKVSIFLNDRQTSGPLIWRVKFTQD